MSANGDSRARVELGIKGEELAATFLEESGFRIVKRNSRIGHSDIDILAFDGDTLVFIEVRTKLKIDRGMPEETLTKKKMQQL
jgi:putative endonuclease